MTVDTDRSAAASTALYRAAAAYLALGLGSGLYYRELTRSQAFEGVTQLAVAHTHLLALGFLVSLLLLVIARILPVGGHRLWRPALWAYHAGMALTTGMMLVKGTGEVLGTWTDRPMTSGIAGLGHILLAVALALFLIVLRPALRASVPAGPAEATGAAGVAEAAGVSAAR